jgi:predicted MPP superfamily phosphohydrolase
MRIVFVISAIFIALTHQAGARHVVSDTLRFAFLTDLHVSPGNENDSGLQLLIEEINSLPLDFVVITGDLTNTGSNDELYAVEQALKKLNHTFYIIPGNHETNWSESAGLLFNRIWGNDRFSFSLKGFNFIGFNTGPYMKMGDGHVKNEDVLWMQEKIKNYFETGQPLIAFAHYPLEDGLDNWDRVSEILKTGNTKLVFCGHGHKQQLLNFNGIPGIMGRALFMKKDNSPGYQLVELRNDSVFVFTKVYRKEQVKTLIQFNYLHPDTLQQISSSKLPDYEINNEYLDTRPVFNWQDRASIFTGLAIYKGRSLIFGNSLGELTSLDIKTKRINWVTKFVGPLFSNPVMIGHTVVLGTSGGMVCGISARSGEILWKHDFKRPVLAEAVHDDHFAYLACGDSAFVKIDARNGKLIWQFTQINGLVQGKPAMDKNRLVFGAWDTWMYCLDKETGKLIWKWNNGKPQKLFSPGNIVPAIAHGKVFLVAPDR